MVHVFVLGAPKKPTELAADDAIVRKVDVAVDHERGGVPDAPSFDPIGHANKRIQTGSCSMEQLKGLVVS
jgi:hypothetical protein